MSNRYLILVILAFAGAPFTASPAAAQGPSFDCARASTAVEGAICGSAALSALDRQLAAAYSARRAALGSSARERLRAEQRGCIGIRDRCGANAGCLSNAMRARIGALQSGAVSAGATSSRQAAAPSAAAQASYMGRWQPKGREATFFSAMTLSSNRLAYDDGLVFDLKQVRPGSNVYRVLSMRGEEPGICSGEGSTHIAFTLTSNDLLQIHHYHRQSAPTDPPPMTVKNMGSGQSGRCSVSHYYR